MIENERRFQVFSLDPTILRYAKVQHMEQGYFERISPVENLRIRIINEREAIIATKTGWGFSREEEPCKTDIKTGRFLLRKADHRLVKTRYIIKNQPNKNGEWTIDIFGQPLVDITLAEFEYREGAETKGKLKIPNWILESTDVTDTLSNLHLARLATDLKSINANQAEARRLLYEKLLTKTIKRIALTGGPCAGKSKIIRTLQKEMSSLVHCVPEVATILGSQLGINLSGGNQLDILEKNKTVYRIQDIFEMTSMREAIAQDKRVVITDRGSLDNAAYISGGTEMLETICRTKLSHEFDKYSAVIFLETPPLEIYEAHRFNNPVRTETYEQAVERSKKIKMVWAKHPNLVTIPGNIPWDNKVKLAFREIIKVVNA